MRERASRRKALHHGPTRHVNRSPSKCFHSITGTTYFFPNQPQLQTPAESVSLPSSTLVAIYTNRRVIGVAAHASVIAVRLLLVRMRRISCMARVNTGEDRIVGRIDMAVGTSRLTVSVREPEIGVVEDRSGPRRRDPRRMATQASRWIIRANVIRHVGAVSLGVRVVRLMAAVAVRGRVAGGVVAADVAVGAGVHHWPDCSGNGRARRQHVRTLQRETRGAVVKLSVGPKHGVVAGGAKCDGETCRDVIRNVATVSRSIVPIFQVALRVPAIARRETGVVVIADVAVRALIYFAGWRKLVRASQREASCAVIKRGGQEGDRVVAVRAVRCGKGRARRRVHRVSCPLPAAAVVCIQVALGIAAIGRLNRQRRVVAVVALVAARDFARRSDLVRIRQRETSVGVIESGISPSDGVMALATE